MTERMEMARAAYFTVMGSAEVRHLTMGSIPSCTRISCLLSSTHHAHTHIYEHTHRRCETHIELAWTTQQNIHKPWVNENVRSKDRLRRARMASRTTFSSGLYSACTSSGIPFDVLSPPHTKQPA